MADIQFLIRPATPSDAGSILSILLEVAPRIPVDLRTEKRRSAMKKIVTTCCESGLSLVAVDANGQVVGFQLAERTRHWHPEYVIHLVYAGVIARAEGHRIFRQFVEREKNHARAHRLPLFAEVSHGNQSNMEATLERYGFDGMEENTIYGSHRRNPRAAILRAFSDLPVDHPAPRPHLIRAHIRS